MPTSPLHTAALALILRVSFAGALGAQLPDDPFADVEAHRLGNGMRVWFRRLSGAPDVSVGIAVPYGWDMDPRGKEELAHFTEHMLFSDHGGLTEEEIKDQVESRGGRRNGYTTADHTFYYVTLPASERLFGLEWLSRILEPHDMAPNVVERNRRPIALEIRARPRQIFDYLRAWVDPPWLHRPPFWKREFGLTPTTPTRYDRYAHLQAITAQDLRTFYATYYTPGAMTLMVVGDVPVDSVLALAEATFGRLASHPAPRGYGKLENPRRRSEVVLWTFRPNVGYRRLFKVMDMDQDEHVRLLFLARLLERRLSARLRFGERKAVYGVATGVAQRGPGAYLFLDAPVEKNQYRYARAVIDGELSALARGDIPPQEFEADRDAIVQRLKAANRDSEKLLLWLHTSFYRRRGDERFPDLAAEWATLGPEDLADFVRAHLIPEQEVLSIRRPQPLPQSVLALLAAVVILGLIHILRRLLTTPADMGHIRFVAHIRWTLPSTVLSLLGLAVGGVVIRLAAAAGEWAAYAWVMPVEVYAYQLAAWVVGGGVLLTLVVVLLSGIPRKVLLFDDHIRIKGMVYRSRVIPLQDVESARLASFREAWAFFPHLVPLAAGVSRPALLLSVRGGRAYYLRLRDARGFLAVFAALVTPRTLPERGCRRSG